MKRLIPTNHPATRHILVNALCTILLFAFTIPAFAQVPIMTVSVTGKVMIAGTTVPVPNHPVKLTAYSSDSTGGYLQLDAYTDQNGEFAITGTLPGEQGYAVLETTVCNEIQSVTFNITATTTSYFNHDFYECDNTTNCMAGFSWMPEQAMTVQFMNQSQGENLAYHWDFGDNTYSYEENPLKTYTQPALYLVTLTIANPDSSCYTSFVDFIQIGDSIPPCMAYFEPSTDPGPGGLTVNFLDMSSGNIGAWFWDFGDGTTAGGQHQIHTYANPGLYTVCLTISSPDSSCYAIYCDDVAVTDDTICQAHFTYHPADSLLTPNTVQFVDFSTGSITSYLWEFGDGTSGSGYNQVHTYGSPGTYQVCLTISGPECQSKWCDDVYVYDTLFPCSNYFTYSNAQNNVTFRGYASPQPAVWQWNFGDGSTATGNNVTHQYQTTGVYTVILLTTSADGCTFTSTQQVIVGDSIEYAQVYGQVFEGNWPLSQGFVFIFSNSTNPSGGYSWFNMTTIDTSGVYVFPMVPYGEYNVLAVPADGSNYLPTYYQSTQFWQEATTVTAGTTPNPVNIQLVEASPLTFQGNCTITGHISAASAKAGKSGTGILDYISEIVVYLTDQNFKILSFTRPDPSGSFSFDNLPYGKYYIRPELSGISSDYLFVELTQSVSAVNLSMTVEGYAILGNDEAPEAAAVRIYPNPATETVRISIHSGLNGQAMLTVNDLRGKLLLQQPISISYAKAVADIPVTALRPGIYLVKVQLPDDSIVTEKLIKK